MMFYQLGTQPSNEGGTSLTKEQGTPSPTPLAFARPNHCMLVLRSIEMGTDPMGLH